MRGTIIILYSLVFLFAYKSNAEEEGVEYYNTCFGGTELPSFDPSTGACQLSSDCYEECLATCNEAHYDILSSMNCVASHHKSSYSYGKGTRQSRYANKKSCRCCCRNEPKCVNGQLAIASGNIDCADELGQCDGICMSTSSPCSRYPGGMWTGESHCILVTTANGLRGACSCCCSYGQVVQPPPSKSPPGCSSGETLCGTQCCTGGCDMTNPGCCTGETLCGGSCCTPSQCLSDGSQCCSSGETPCGTQCCTGGCDMTNPGCCTGETLCGDGGGQICCPSSGTCCGFEPPNGYGCCTGNTPICTEFCCAVSSHATCPNE